MTRPWIPAYKRLQDLPAVFSLADVRMVHDASPEYAKVMASRWKEAGYIKPVGPKVGVYYNLVVDPEGPSRRVAEAVRKVFRSPVLIGPSVLQETSWLTQIPHVLTVAVPKDRTHPEVDGVKVYDRGRQWYQKVAPGVVMPDEAYPEASHASLPKLSPEYAIADAEAMKDCIRLADDDVEIDWDEVDEEAMEAAFDAFDLDFDEFKEESQGMTYR